MKHHTEICFSAKIAKIGINPYVLLPQAALNQLFVQAGRDRSPIPIRGTLEGHPFIQNLVKYQGKWRLYLNTPMRKAAGLEVGNTANFSIAFDPSERTLIPHPK